MSDFNDFVDLIHNTTDRELLKDLLLGVTTARERAEFVRRVDVINLLLGGVAQLSISEILGVGIATITRGNKELLLGRFKVLRNRSVRETWQDSWQIKYV